MAKKCCCNKGCSCGPEIADLQTQIDNTCEGVRTIYRYEPSATPGLNVRFWDSTHGAHTDPLSWTGPADLNGFPLPTANPPDLTSVNNATNINDSNSGLANARYGIIDGWVFLPEGTTHIRDNNANTGEFGMVLTASCCASSLTEQPGGNHTVNTSGQDRTLMDSVPATGGWLYVYSPQSDSGAANGLDLEYSLNGGTTWANVAIMQPTKPVVECDEISACDPIPEGWGIKPLQACCDATYIASGGLSEDEVIALVGPHVEGCDTDGDYVSDNNHSDGGWSRTGDAGNSDEFARCNHKHPIVRIPNPGDPVITITGPGTIGSQAVLRRWSDEESYEYGIRVNVLTTTANGWVFLTIPNIAGFQRPIISGIGSYRYGGNYDNQPVNGAQGNQGSAPNAAWMGQELNSYLFTQRIYIGRVSGKETEARWWVNFNVKYIRA